MKINSLKLKSALCKAVVYIFVLTWVLIVGTDLVQAQPKIPQDYTSAIFAELINKVEVNDNDAVIKMFFNGHRRYTLSKADAVAALELTLKSETRGSKRWFLLQKSRAFGSMKTSKEGAQKAVEVYGGIFDEANKIQDLSNRDYLRNIIYDFISYIPTPYLSGQQSGAKATASSLDEVLLKALKTYFLLGSPMGVWQPDWPEAINYTSSDVWPYMTVVQDAVKNSAIPKNANFYKVAITVLTYSDTADREEAQKLRDELKQAASNLKE